MKKIVFLHPAHWEQAMGGAELQISYLVKYFAKNDYEVHFIFEDKKKLIKNNDKVILHPLKKVEKFIGLRWFIDSNVVGQRWFLYSNKIKKKLSNIEPDIIYTRFYSSWSGIAAKYASEYKIKHIWAIAHDNDLRGRLNLKTLLKPFDIIESIAVRNAFKYASNIIVQNSFQKKDLLGKHKRNSIKVLQMGEGVDIYEIKKSKKFINIVWIANLKPIKRPDIFLKLVNELSVLSNCNFFMVGRPSQKYQMNIDEISKKIANFKFLGELSIEKVNHLLCQSHILINTSDAEGFSNTFIQAWMRKVIVLTMNSNPDEIITNENIGFVCPTLDLLREKTELLSKNNELRESLSNKAMKYARENHSVENNILKILKIIS